MPDLLLELFSEEIPARMQVRAAKELERLLVGALSDHGLLFEWARSFAGACWKKTAAKLAVRIREMLA